MTIHHLFLSSRRMLLLLSLIVSTTDAWICSSKSLSQYHYPISIVGQSQRWGHVCSVMSHTQNDNHPGEVQEGWARHLLPQPLTSRRNILASISLATSFVFSSQPSFALVKGVAPPPPRSKTGSGDKPKCTNVEECQALAEQREAQLRAEEDVGPPPMVTKGGVKYRDIETGQSEQVVQVGDNVNLYFKVLKLGKRSYDGLSGEGTVVFSRGYGLEDDEDKPGTKSFQTTVGNTANIAALNEALIGMKLQGIRRFAILPQKGWEKATAACDGGPGGRGAGGDLRTDYVVVPTAQIVEQESCFDKNKLPFPATYAQQRRMAQRFDQSLIMEVQVVDIHKNN
ncbi:FKBP-type peptidyl-prolyl cis-trans isomerase [Nitzschia inconspicua]|uniref:FKBP-type peptidyl-prolyl cis-trans isomerase n=1 Tax=Nitzschia inconspicua TaxID=303405 RepID=A0A9K3LZR1_9STRA|nr:FKBP-type peptidyl-prolyl cis-trans isomerase [Nitzschia inconspicua]